MTTETVFSNARIVLGHDEIKGHLVVRDGMISDIGQGPASGEDMAGDVLVPGLVELHTDHIEGHFNPRPRVYWDRDAAIQAHDAQIAASGITTVFDAIRVGTDDDAMMTADMMDALAGAIAEAEASGRTRAEHFIHVRCEVSATDAFDGFERLSRNPRVKLASLMDHAPGQRQFVSLDAYRVYYQKKRGLNDDEFDVFMERRLAESRDNSGPNRQAIATLCNRLGIAVASHDDATDAHVDEAMALGTRIAEFPTTDIAAKASREAGLAILMGAPNIVRGGSHSGNIAAHDLLAAGHLDILSSDYVPFSLIQAAFLLAREGASDLSGAIRLVSKNPAEAAGLTDRGEIAVGKRADLVRVSLDGSTRPPVVRSVFREGVRVA